MKLWILFGLICITPLLSICQEVTISEIQRREDSLLVLLQGLRSAKSDSLKDSVNFRLSEYVTETLQLKESFTYPFSKLKTIGFVDSPDGSLRIVNWNIERNDQTQHYECFILRKNKDKIQLSRLIESPDQLQKPDGVLEANEWYGALYYKIIPKQSGTKKNYILLGWDGNRSSSTIKMIDVLYFSGNQPKLGAPIFKQHNLTPKRIFFEHAKKVSISLKYEPEYDRIIYDHLSPESPSLSGFYEYYVPDLSYDALYFEDGKWILKEDVVGVNKADGDHKEVYIRNERSGKIEKVEIKDKWENPDNNASRSGESDHKAALPGEEPKDLEEIPTKSRNKDEKMKTNDKRDPNQLNTTTGSGSRTRKKDDDNNRNKFYPSHKFI